MRSQLFFGALCLVNSVLSLTTNQREDFKLIGYGKENPLGGTIGGKGGPTVTIKGNLTALQEAVLGDKPKIIYVEGDLTTNKARIPIGSNTSIIGTKKGANITIADFEIYGQTNVIIQNVGISFTQQAKSNIDIRNSTRVWIDHCELFDDKTEFGDLISIVDGSDWITVSWNYMHTHARASTVNQGYIFPHYPNTGHVTYHHNHWHDIDVRAPAARFATLHIHNNLYTSIATQAIKSIEGTQMLVEGNVFRNTKEAVTTNGLVLEGEDPYPPGLVEGEGFVNLGKDNDWGGASVNITRVGNFTAVPYKYKLTPLEKVESVVRAGVGLGKIF